MTTEFKQTKIGKIPQEWMVVKLEEVFRFRNGQRPEISDNGRIPVYGANGIMGHSNTPLTNNDFTLIVGRVGASGEIHLAEGKMWVSDNAIYSEQYNKSKIYPPFAHFLLKFKNLKRYATKTTHPLITQTFLNSYSVPLPQIIEQKKIARVLSDVGDAIHLVDSAISQTERLKKGLMQKLLTEGIGHKEFKKTKLGKIPKTWKVSTIERECVLGTGGTPRRSKPEYFGGNIPWVKSTEIDYNVITSTEESLTKSGLKNSNAKIYPSGSLVLALYGQGVTRGKCAIFGIDAAVNQACAVIQSSGQIYLPYLFYWFQQEYSNIRSLSQGANQANLNMTIIRSLKLPLPDFFEQQKIVDVLSTVDSKLGLDRKRKEKLERIKRGLMNDLLTGKRRVKVGVNYA
jgi:type I restriction enzyme S subunit